MFNVLSVLLDENPNEEWITIQGETYGATVQNRTYSLEGRDFAAFNLIFSSKGRVGTREMIALLDKYGIPCVPVVEVSMKINQFENVDAILTYAEGTSAVDGLPREGIVFRTEDGQKSFKAVSNSFLLKYHG
jgi:ATP-dependent RNA circularization protein (DNA/RNA ligase family)